MTAERVQGPHRCAPRSSRHRRRRPHHDRPNRVAFGLIEAANHSWGSFRVLGPLVASVVVLVTFVLVELRVREPLVPLTFFQNRTRVTANGLTFVFASVFFTMFFVLTLYWAQVEGWSAIKIGMPYLPSAS